MADSPISNKDFYSGDGKVFDPIIKNIDELTTKMADLLKIINESSKALKGMSTGTDSKSIKASAEETKRLELAILELSKAETARLNLGKELEKQIKIKMQTESLAKKNTELVSNEYKKQSALLTTLRNEYKNLAAQEKQNTTEAKALLKQITALDSKLTQIDKSVGQHTRSVGSYTKSIKSATASFLGQLGFIGVIGTAIQALKGIITNTARFEQNLKTMQAVVQGTDEEMAKIGITAKDVGSKYGKSAVEVSKMQIELGKLGLTASEINNATGAILALSIATGEDLVKSGEIAASVMRQFGLTSLDMTRITDVMTETFNASASGLDDFGESMKYVGPLANVTGISLERTSAMLAVLANNGIKGSQAGTALRRIFVELAQEGGDVDVAFEKITKSGLTTTGALDEVGRNAVTALTILANNKDELEGFTKGMDNVTGATIGAADAMGDTLLGAWNKLTASILNSSIIEWFANDLKAAITNFRILIFGAADDIKAKYTETYMSIISTDRKRILNAKNMEAERVKVFRSAKEEMIKIDDRLSNEYLPEAERKQLKSDRNLAVGRYNAAVKIKTEIIKIEKDRASKLEQILIEEYEKGASLRKKEQSELDKLSKERAAQRKKDIEARNKDTEDFAKIGAKTEKTIYREVQAERKLDDEDFYNTVYNRSDYLAEINEKIIEDEQKKQDKIQAIQTISAEATNELFNVISFNQEQAKQRELAAAGDNAEKKLAIEKEYAKKQQQLALKRAIVEGGLSVLFASQLPPPAGFVAAATAAIQVAGIIATMSTQKFAKGGTWVEGGRSHAEGGNRYGDKEFERGEQVSVFSVNATNKHSDVITDFTNAINKDNLDLFTLNFQRKPSIFVNTSDSKLVAIAEKQYNETQKMTKILSNTRTRHGNTITLSNGNQQIMI